MTLGRCNHPIVDMACDLPEGHDAHSAHVDGFDARPATAQFRAQAFFAELAAQTRAPHYGGPAREFTQAILLRAIERGLYTPETP